MLEQNLNETIIRFHKKTNEYILNNRVLGVEEVKTLCELSQRDVRIVTTEKRKRISKKTQLCCKQTLSGNTFYVKY